MALPRGRHMAVTEDLLDRQIEHPEVVQIASQASRKRGPAVPLDHVLSTAVLMVREPVFRLSLTALGHKRSVSVNPAGENVLHGTAQDRSERT